MFLAINPANTLERKHAGKLFDFSNDLNI